jgi:hypothetical protein
MSHHLEVVRRIQDVIPRVDFWNNGKGKRLHRDVVHGALETPGVGYVGSRTTGINEVFVGPKVLLSDDGDLHAFMNDLRHSIGIPPEFWSDPSLREREEAVSTGILTYEYPLPTFHYTNRYGDITYYKVGPDIPETFVRVYPHAAIAQFVRDNPSMAESLFLYTRVSYEFLFLAEQEGKNFSNAMKERGVTPGELRAFSNSLVP